MVAIAFLTAVDGINHRNHPSKARSILIKAICALIIAVAFMLHLGTFEGNEWGVVAAGITIAGSVVISLGAFKNAKMGGGRK
jgi:membrane protein YdbS with pleckstrin-like domain